MKLVYKGEEVDYLIVEGDTLDENFLELCKKDIVINSLVSSEAIKQEIEHLSGIRISDSRNFKILLDLVYSLVEREINDVQVLA